MRDCILGKLPNLEEVVIIAGSRLELSFEDPMATFSALENSMSLESHSSQVGLTGSGCQTA